jgi:hypothetical protein
MHPLPEREAPMFRQHADEDLDPRRVPRNIRRRDWASRSMTVAFPRLHDLLASIIARIERAR